MSKSHRERVRRSRTIGVVAALLAIVVGGYLVQSTRDASGRGARVG